MTEQLSEAEIRAVERAHLKAADTLRSTRGSIYRAFDATNCGVTAAALREWWEAPGGQAFGEDSGRAFGCALGTAMVAVEADRILREERRSL